MKGNDFMKVILGFLLTILVIGLVVGLFCLESLAIMLLVNWLVPAIFPSFVALTFGQSCALNLICFFLFGGITVRTRRD